MPANGRLSVAAGFKGAAEGMSTDVRNCTFRTSPPITAATSTATASRPRPSSRALRLGDGDEPPGRGPRDRRCRPQGARLRLGSPARLRRTRRHLRARLRRARKARRSRAPPTVSKSATRSASSPAIATRPSTSTTGMSASAATASSSSGRSPPAARFIDARRPAIGRDREPATGGEPIWCLSWCSDAFR
jgi:hypothetical protein